METEPEGTFRTVTGMVRGPDFSRFEPEEMRDGGALKILKSFVVIYRCNGSPVLSLGGAGWDSNREIFIFSKLIKFFVTNEVNLRISKSRSARR